MPGLSNGITTPSAQPVSDPATFAQKYQEERDKRIKAEGTNQYIDLRSSEKYRNFVEDPWIESGTAINTPVPNDGHTKILILGAGFGGILFAVRLLQAGVKRDDIVIVDPAGGFGGTWYWNRYPGLMCDVESYIYLPLLEEMGYIPTTKYAFGFEIRQYIESICSKYGLQERAMFQSTVKAMAWNEQRREWDVKIAKQPKGGKASEHSVHANFATMAPGLLSNIKLPDMEGIDTFTGKMFHTARWDYAFTGGCPEDPHLTGLRGKKVGVVGTGATCVQALPHLARYAEKLYVFQRTPSSVDYRGNRDTDVQWFKSNVATKNGWQRERNANFNDHIENLQPKPTKDLVDDGWTHMPSYSGLIGSQKPVTMENVGEHLQQLHALDQPRQMRIHQRIEETVKDPDTANKLKPWYAGWCKRPCFHDEYLQAFNHESVELVDTDGKGLECVTSNGIRAAREDYDLDVIIWSTGFKSPAIGSVATRAEISVTGRDGLDMDNVNGKGELLTLHGTLSRGFPNLFWTGPMQAGTSANYTFAINTMATHSAYIISRALKDTSGTPAVEPTAEAQEEWAMQIAAGAAAFAGMAGCTPSYLNKEGETDRMTMEQKMSGAKNGIWPGGFESYLNAIEDWEAQGDMKGIEVY